MTSLLSPHADRTEGIETDDFGPRRRLRARPGFRARLTDHLAVAIGTSQGLFLVSDGMPDGPFFKGSSVTAFLQIGSRYYAATASAATASAATAGAATSGAATAGATTAGATTAGAATAGPGLWVSDDGGVAWVEPGSFESFVLGGQPATQICQLQPDRTSKSWDNGGSDVPLFVGVEPAGLFRSTDGGTTFAPLSAVNEHADRAAWCSGTSPASLHSIVTHPARPGRIVVAVSTGGVYRSDDGGETFCARNAGLPASGPSSLPRVHKLAGAVAEADTLWTQTDAGVFRSSDAGDSWAPVGRSGQPGGLASDFGFPVVGHPVEPETAFVFPLESGAYPFSPAGHCRVYRTIDGGERWGALSQGLPLQNAHVTVLGEAFTAGEGAPYPLVFGTRAGELFASVDSGETWRLVVAELPPVLCVRVLD